MGLCSSNCPTHKKAVYLFPHAQQIATKKQLKFKTLEIILKIQKKGKKKTIKIK
jgi:hypothetical protein